MTNAEQREQIVAEAQSWVGTPYRLGGRTKGIGADCATLILQILVNCGVFTNERLGMYSIDWWCHATSDKYLMNVLRHATKVLQTVCYKTLEIEPGNIVLCKVAHSKVYNHGAIVTQYPYAVHAVNPAVARVDLSSNHLWAFQEAAIFDPFIAPDRS